MYITKLNTNDNKQISRLEIDKGFDWNENIKPILPGCPNSCPATHFGYLLEGEMEITMDNGEKHTILQGDSYLVQPGHLPIFRKKTIMIEFFQDSTYTNKEFINK